MATSVEGFGRAILKEGKKWKVRVLRPVEYSGLREGANEAGRIQLDALLYTGMRYVEMQRLRENPTWLDTAGFVYLPQAAILKAKRRQLNRWVKLNVKGKEAVSKYLEGPRLPTWNTWTEWLREWAAKTSLSSEGLGPKTTRKTWESWLTFYYGQNRLLEIVQSQGHTTGTSLHHYLSMPFLPKDREDMTAYVDGMF